MIKLFALYKKPDDVDAFMRHYENVHMPLVEKIPGLEKSVVNRVTGAPMGGEPDYFIITEMQFPDQATFEKAMASPENRAVGKDAMEFAGDLITVMTAKA
ncbi:MAG: EthD family reductase [Pseudomonadota bacterium]